jgi:hypothetical protein
VRKRAMRVGGLLLLLAGIGCAGTVTGGRRAASAPLSGAEGGASSPRAVVEGFMRAVKEQDLQTMGALWGTVRGPARNLIDRDQLEKRLIIIQCKLDHDQWRYAEERPRLLAGGKQDFQVRLRQKSIEAVTSFTTVLGADNRWYVEIVDLEPLGEFCR